MSEEIMSSRKLAAPVAASALIAVLMFASMCLPLHEDWNVAKKVPPKIWLSMAVCFSSNTGSVVTDVNV